MKGKQRKHTYSYLVYSSMGSDSLCCPLRNRLQLDGIGLLWDAQARVQGSFQIRRIVDFEESFGVIAFAKDDILAFLKKILAFSAPLRISPETTYTAFSLHLSCWDRSNSFSSAFNF